MDALDPPPGHEHFAVGRGRRQGVDLPAGDLEADVRLGLAGRGRLIIVGARHGAHRPGQAAQYPVVVKALDQLKRSLDLGEDGVGLLAPDFGGGLDGRVELDLEQVQDQPRHAGMGRQGGLLHGLTGVKAGLLTPARQGPDQGRLAPGNSQFQNQTIEAVALGAAGPDRDQSGFEGGPHLVELDRLALGVLQQIVVDPYRLAGVARRPHGKARLIQPLQSHVLDNRQDVRQGCRPRPDIELEAEAGCRVAGGSVGAHPHRLAAPGQVVDNAQVAQGLRRVIAIAIAGREGVAPSREVGGRIAVCGAQRGLETVGPAPQGLGDLRLEGAQVRLRVLARQEPDDDVDADQGLVRDAGIDGRDLAGPGSGQDGGCLACGVGVVAFARGVEQHRREPVEGVAPDEDPHPGPVVEVEHPVGDVQQGVFVDLEQLVAGVGLDDVTEPALVVLAGGADGARQDVLDLAAYQRDLSHGQLVGVGREQAHEPHLARWHAVRPVASHADEIHVGAPVDP